MIEKVKGVDQVTGFYRGIVKKHLDNGRCKIWIPAVYDIKYKDSYDSLPDAQQATPLFGVSSGTDDAANGNGLYSYPEIGTIVWCFFENNDINLPVYFAATREFGQSEASYKELTDNNKNAKILKVDNVKIMINGDSEKFSITIGKEPDVAASIKIFDDGSISMNGKSITINAEDKLDLHASNIDIHSDNETTINSKLNVEMYGSSVFVESYGGGIDLVGDIDEIVVS